jgi:hypothetical protein
VPSAVSQLHENSSRGKRGCRKTFIDRISKNIIFKKGEKRLEGRMQLDAEAHYEISIGPDASIHKFMVEKLKPTIDIGGEHHVVSHGRFQKRRRMIDKLGKLCDRVESRKGIRRRIDEGSNHRDRHELGRLAKAIHENWIEVVT